MIFVMEAQHPIATPVSSSSTSQRRYHEQTFGIFLERQASGFGFQIAGGAEEGSQVRVARIEPEGAADISECLLPGDEILQVNDVSVLNITRRRMLDIMESALQNICMTLVLRRRHSGKYVTLVRKETERFGFFITTPAPNQLPCISDISENTPAKRCGQLQIGDRIVEVNGIHASRMSYRELINYIKDPTCLVITLNLLSPDTCKTVTGQVAADAIYSRESLILQPSADLSIAYPNQAMTGAAVQQFVSCASEPRQGEDVNRIDNTVPPTTVRIDDSNSTQILPSGKDTLTTTSSSSSSTATDARQMFTVILYRKTSGYGFQITGGVEEDSHIHIASLEPGGAADESKLLAGDEILEVNNLTMLNITRQRMLDIMESALLKPSMALILHRQPVKHDVTLVRKDTELFGFFIISPGNNQLPFIASISKNNPGTKYGQLKVGDRILAINGVDLTSSTPQEAACIIKESAVRSVITLTIEGPPPDNVPPTLKPVEDGVTRNTERNLKRRPDNDHIDEPPSKKKAGEDIAAIYIDEEDNGNDVVVDLSKLVPPHLKRKEVNTELEKEADSVQKEKLQDDEVVCETQEDRCSLCKKKVTTPNLVKHKCRGLFNRLWSVCREKSPDGINVVWNGRKFLSVETKFRNKTVIARLGDTMHLQERDSVMCILCDSLLKIKAKSHLSRHVATRSHTKRLQSYLSSGIEEQKRFEDELRKGVPISQRSISLSDLDKASTISCIHCGLPCSKSNICLHELTCVSKANEKFKSINTASGNGSTISSSKQVDISEEGNQPIINLTDEADALKQDKKQDIKELSKFLTTKEKPYKCAVCFAEFKRDNRRQFLLHFKVHKEKQFSCKICDKRFCMIRKYQRHVLHHAIANAKGCPMCGLPIWHMRNAKNSIYWLEQKHDCNYYETLESDEIEKSLKCKLCDGLEFKTKTSAFLHSFLHVASSQYPCDKCDLSFATRTDRILHKYEKHHMNYKSKHRCKMCMSQFINLQKLQAHDENCTAILQFKCEICLQAFKTSKCLKVHLRIHTKSRSIPANIGGMDYHTNIKLKQCPLCPWLTTDDDRELHDHIAIHIGEEKLKSLGQAAFKQCFICSHVCGSLFNVFTHIQAMHKDKIATHDPSKCAFCHENVDNMYQHIKEKHSNKSAISASYPSATEDNAVQILADDSNALVIDNNVEEPVREECQNDDPLIETCVNQNELADNEVGDDPEVSASHTTRIETTSEAVEEAMEDESQMTHAESAAAAEDKAEDDPTANASHAGLIESTDEAVEEAMEDESQMMRIDLDFENFSSQPESNLPFLGESAQSEGLSLN